MLGIGTSCYVTAKFLPLRAYSSYLQASIYPVICVRAKFFALRADCSYLPDPLSLNYALQIFYTHTHTTCPIAVKKKKPSYKDFILDI